ncbi:3-hydroxyacyl-CoA dehydrogenase NAD-binding domain-containing protein [Bacterioplanoides sp.]|uniref:3-hydroxyacyl-CoA dehydrogenase NAD-binding domain-containing protein n=1 Tax=Bacterioplanoides sp. TaxID=2066072 RepID=UPI003B5AE572
MTQAVNYKRSGNLALIVLNGDAVNSLGQDLRQQLQDAIKKAANDNSQAVVIYSLAKVFCAGADIKEFSQGDAFASPALPTVLNAIEALNKPVIAAMNGVALGGGLELALACDYRIADQHCQLGLPEVSLGIIPGAGGTQRLPRIVGIQHASDMILSGKPCSAEAAMHMGLVDRIDQSENLLDAALAYAEEIIIHKEGTRSCSDTSLDMKGIDSEFFSQRQDELRRKKGSYAQQLALEAIQAAVALPLHDGLKKEKELFIQASNSSQARALQHVFFAQRAAQKIPGLDDAVTAREIKQVAIIGAGTMGGGIAMNFANAGIPVKLLEIKDDALQRGLNNIHQNYEISVSRGRISQQQAQACQQHITGTLNYQDLSDCDLVIEAVFEDIAIKTQVFKQLDQVCKPGAILATNTSYQDVDLIAAATKRPQDVIGLHFFSPANVMRLLEVVRGARTSDQVLLTTLNIARRIKKTAVVSGVCWGFIGNRMFEPYGREATRLVLEGASPAEVDHALTEFGFAMGFCSVIDLAGIDVGYLAREGIRSQLQHDPSYQVICDHLNHKGHLGQKTKRGFYIYEGRDRIEDNSVITLAEELAAQLQVNRRDISAEEIVERTLFAMINEGARILEENIAYRASDIDLVFINGYGFPAWRGGTMQYANEIGLQRVLDGLTKYQQTLGDYGTDWFKPANLLIELVQQNKTFADLES